VRIKGLWKPDPNLTVSAMAVINRTIGRPISVTALRPATFTQFFNLTHDAAAQKRRRPHI